MDAPDEIAGTAEAPDWVQNTLRAAKFTAIAGIAVFHVESEAPVSPGDDQVRAKFVYDGDGPGKGGLATLCVDGAPVGSGRVERTHISLFTFAETTDVGRDPATPVTSEYPAGDNAFSGEIKWVRIDLGDDDHTHLVDPAHLLQAVMTHQ